MFVRFVVGHDREHHRGLTGIITEARFLCDGGRLDPHEREQLEEVYEWLNANVPVPPYSQKSWSEDSVAWFKDDAPAISRMWELVGILKAHGTPIRLLRSKHPGPGPLRGQPPGGRSRAC